MTKNIQVIDGAINSTFDIYEIPDEQFEILFSGSKDVAFIEDFPELIDNIDFWGLLYSRITDKKNVNGIQGTLHLTGSYAEKEEFPNRQETDVR